MHCLNRINVFCFGQRLDLKLLLFVANHERTHSHMNTCTNKKCTHAHTHAHFHTQIKQPHRQQARQRPTKLLKPSIRKSNWTVQSWILHLKSLIDACRRFVVSNSTLSHTQVYHCCWHSGVGGLPTPDIQIMTPYLHRMVAITHWCGRYTYVYICICICICICNTYSLLWPLRKQRFQPTPNFSGKYVDACIQFLTQISGCTSKFKISIS